MRKRSSGFLSGLGRGGKRGGGGQAAQRRAFTVEQLEAREMLSAVCQFNGQHSANLSDPLNYAGQQIPSSGDTLQILSAVPQSINNDLPNRPVLDGLEFQAGNFSIDGSTLEVAGQIKVDDAYTATITANLALNGTVQCDVASGGSLKVTGQITDDTGTVGTIETTGAGTLTLTSPNNSYTGGTLLGGGMVSFWAGALSTGNIEFQRNSTLQWGNPNEVWPQDVSSRLAIDLGVTATLDVGSQQVIFASEFASRDQGSLVVTGFQGYGSTWGSLTLSAENSFAGSVSVDQTVLTVTEPTVFEGSVRRHGADGPRLR